MTAKSGVQQFSLYAHLTDVRNRKLAAAEISHHNPPDIRDALVIAAALRDVEEIDRITDEVVRTRPDRFVARNVARAEFASRGPSIPDAQ